MKRNPEYILRNIAGESIVVPTGSAGQNLNGLITLNDTAAFLWQNLEKVSSREELVDLVLDNFEIDAETARRDVNGFLHMMLQNGFATEDDA